MKLLVDCTPLAAGGGVQAAIAFLTHLLELPELEWLVAAPDAIRTAFPENLVSDSRVTFLAKSHFLDRVTIPVRLSLLERRFNPDVVFSVFGPAYFSARAPHVVGFALPNLIYERDGPLHKPTAFDRVLDWLRCVSLRRADHLIVETQTVQRRLSARIGVPIDRISVIENSVNPRLRRLKPERADGRFRIFVPSAYYSHKNLEIVPRVAQKMQFLAPNLEFQFQLTLAAESHAWLGLVEAAKHAKVEHRLETLGVLPIDHLSQAYADASAVFLPTLREASTAVYPESFFFERPLVTSDMDFARELCGDAAIFVPPLSAEAAAAALVKLQGSEADQKVLIKAGRDRLVNAYPTAEAKFARQLVVIGNTRAGGKIRSLKRFS